MKNGSYTCQVAILTEVSKFSFVCSSQFLKRYHDTSVVGFRVFFQILFTYFYVRYSRSPHLSSSVFFLITGVPSSQTGIP